MTQTNTELQRKFDEDRAAWLNDKKTLEDTIVDLSTSAQSTQTDRGTWELEIHRQEERAKVSLVQEAWLIRDVNVVSYRLRRNATLRRLSPMQRP